MGVRDDVVAKRPSIGLPTATCAGPREVLDHVVFADPGHAEAKPCWPTCFTQLGYGAENGTWRCEFLSAASGSCGPATSAPRSRAASADMSPTSARDAVRRPAIQVDGPKAWDLDLAIRWTCPTVAPRNRTTLHNGVLTYLKDSDKPVGLTLTIPAAAMFALGRGNMDAARQQRAHPPRGDESPAQPRCSASCNPATRAFNNRRALADGNR
jgi:alkyl sulfatase BDS1-like metallo-beta-lactamase superfamily hydrolase